MQCDLVEKRGQYAARPAAGHVAMRQGRRAAAGAAIVFMLTLCALPAIALRAAVPAACDAPTHVQLLHPEAQGAPPARAYWLDRATLRWPGPMPAPAERVVLAHSAQAALRIRADGRLGGADRVVSLGLRETPVPRAVGERFRHVSAGPTFTLPQGEDAAALLIGQLWLVRLSPRGKVIESVAVQSPGALDDRYAAAAGVADLGATVRGAQPGFALWAPTASAVSLCLYSGARPDARGAADAHVVLTRDFATGVWRGGGAQAAHGRVYAYLVDVYAPGHGIVRNRVTDPYSLGLTADSQRSVVLDLDAPDTKPDGWNAAPRPPALVSAVDMSLYELHVRDFSRDDASVRAPWRGKYLAFTEPDSAGIRHLRALRAAGMTDIHLLPTYDLSTVPERDCVVPAIPAAAPDSEAQQAAVAAVAARDCFNWGYDPWHYTVPEGSYAVAPDGAARVREFRAMVQALHAAGLRVGLDVVYNHTFAAGQDEKSVLDRIVPGYYQRLNADGKIERSTCCENTATEHAMMAKLMIDSAVVWVRDYRIDSFRFDLMGHQPRAAMERLQAAVDRAAGRRIDLIGEGWNFGEVANGARFVQASQLSLPDSGIATFSDRARDALRGGGCCDSGEGLVANQGLLNGLHYAPNAVNTLADGRERDRRAELLRAADLARIGLAGTLRDYELQGADGVRRPLSAFDYAGQAAGYAAQPHEVVNYVENHDNLTLFDLNALRLPRETSPRERARVQLLGVAFTAFSQGIAYYHAGIEILRSKSLDKNSFDSGDAFNRLDWSYTDNGFGQGLPPAKDNGRDWPAMRAVLADAGIKPAPEDIRWMRDASLDLMRIRDGSSLFRLRSADAVRARLSFRNTGPQQNPLVIAAHLDGQGLDGAGFRELLYFINVSPEAQTLVLPEDAGKRYVLHPVQAAADAADTRPKAARHSPREGRFTIPPRTAVVFVIPE
jgi:pullulanase/glycogen debranching enzyme